MNAIPTNDPVIETIIQTKFHNDTTKFLEAVKEFFQKDSKAETYEYNLLKAYDRGELSIGQIANILNLDKLEVMELLEKYDIAFVRVDEEYLEQEFNAL
jgi:hypothetical protein